ncbi:hypothetical protein SAMN05421666_2468 [Roseovarius nanhaiticus]|uniref:Uncharacterized protein n=1 Tax=Roseovarius nanhaiticus TaxID=573024 RepID=A0A1N7H4C9_9RHOB|nr:hypothetical protein SAMN05216208_2851 [Roseovarius nanhaiticus]SIS19653.1 hypothetical protein SAMN05421666_2468 [Roseovarius nanhaiticus]
MQYKFLADISPCFAHARMRAVDVSQAVAVTYSGVRLRMHEQPRGLTHSNRTQRGNQDRATARIASKQAAYL